MISTRSSFRWCPKYGDIDLKAVNKSSISEDLNDESTPEKAEELKPLLGKIKAALGDAVKEVRASSRLADSPSVI
jgi:molecular chaperone HtpG